MFRRVLDRSFLPASFSVGFATVLTDPGRVPENWHPFVDDAVDLRLLSLIFMEVDEGG